MTFIKKWVGCLFFLSASVGFAEEIIQGSLKNGMRYYIWSDFHQKNFKISLAVKKTQEHLSLPVPDVFFVRGSFPMPFYQWTSMGAFRFCFFEGTTRYALKDGLEYLSRFLREKSFSDRAVQELRVEYQDDVEESLIEDPEWWRISTEVEKFLYGCESGYADFVFSQGDDFIRRIYQALFEPSRMALVITGPFDPYDVQYELENLFEEISEDGLLKNPAQLKIKQSVTVAIKKPEIVELLLDRKDSFSDLVKEVNVCFYQLEPSFKEYVLNDLFLFIHLGKERMFSFSTESLLGSNCHVPFVGKVAVSQVDEILFHRAKIELEEMYRQSKSDKMEQCIRHFLSEIPDCLELSNQNLLHELENVTLEDLNFFIDQKINSIGVTYELDV